MISFEIEVDNKIASPLSTLQFIKLFILHPSLEFKQVVGTDKKEDRIVTYESETAVVRIKNIKQY